MHNDKIDNWYRKQGQEPPERISHDLTPDDISERVKPLNPTNWRQEGNKLIADTDMGKLVQFIPTNLLFNGVDKNGLPILTKIKAPSTV